ncbi:MAG: DUF1499 domain-containing protein [Promethearchaeota archaeon]|jgi:uncharacterized protein (DUF1499 family)
MSREFVGMKDGKFHPCPKSPNCVSTQSLDDKHKLQPLEYTGTIEEVKSKIKEIIATFKRTKLVTEQQNYLHYEFRTATFKFIDDVEFYFEDANNLIHFRSGARTGWSDMGVNRKRMLKVTKMYRNS